MGRTETDRQITNEPKSSRPRKRPQVRKRKKNPLLSDWRGLLKKCLTGSTLLEMSGNALSLTTPAVARDFISYFFCPRTHPSYRTRIASLWLRSSTCLCRPNQLGPFPLHRSGVAHQTSLRSPSTMMSYAISPEGGGSPNQSDGDSSHHNAFQAFPHRHHHFSVASAHDDRTLGNQSDLAT